MANFEIFLAKKYIKGKKRSAFISTITYLSLVGIMLGVAILIIVMSVMNGFEKEVKSRFIDSDAHLRIRSFGDKPFSYSKELKNKLQKKQDIKIIKGFSPYMESYAMIKSDNHTGGTIIRGVDPKSIDQVIKLRSQIIAGNLELEANNKKYGGIIIGKGMADNIGAYIGDVVKVISPAISSTFSQPPVKIFTVTGIFESGLAEIDAGICYISLSDASHLFRAVGKVNGVYINIHDIKRTKEIQKDIDENLDYPLNVVSWQDMHKNLYAWMSIEKMMMGTILSLLIIIAAFNILSSLVMVVMEKKKEIGILMSFGASKKTIMKIFIYQGMIVGVIGTAFGVILGITTCILQKKFSLVSLPSDIYFINAMPIDLHTSDIILVVGIALLMTFLSTIYPSYQAGKLLPAQIIREE